MLPIISASRRTDLPRVFPEKLAEWIRQGFAPVQHPYNHQIRSIEIIPEKIHTIVLWSKDFSPLVNNKYGLFDQIKRYAQVFFHFTVTGMGGTVFEPGIIPFHKAISQFAALTRIAGNPLRVNWRFDPIVHWYEGSACRSNLSMFEEIALHAKDSGIESVTISQCHWYQKSIHRAKAYNIRHCQLNHQEFVKSLFGILESAYKIGILVKSCCMSGDIPNGITPGKCIDGELLSNLHPGRLKASLAMDQGQRNLCNCTKSIDVGSYDLSCPDGCVYCYANPKALNKRRDHADEIENRHYNG